MVGKLYAEDMVKTIYLVTWRGFEEGCEGFKEYLDTRGIKYRLVHKDIARDKSKLPGIVQDIKSTKPDLVVTWGTSVSVGVLGTYDNADSSNHITEIASVFMFPTNPQRSKLVKDYSTPRRNVTGVRYVLTEQQQLTAALASLSFKKMGIIENRDEINVVNSINSMRQAGKASGVDILVEAIAKTTEKDETLSTLKIALKKLKASGAELIYFPPSSLLNSYSQEFTSMAVELGLPIFSSGQNPVREGKAAIGVGVPYRQTGKRAAVLAEKILAGSKPEDLSIDAPEEFGVVVNMSVVNELGLKVSPDILSVAEIVQN
ncbi:ABC transporter substrate-binding protein [Candidatus Terasakiella magnetica]|nr:ABC transporter substrate-binding protein [Candidatus Terasakiella magnetica]